MMLEEARVESGLGDHARKVWLLRPAEPPRHVALFLDGELYLRRVEADGVLRELMTGGRIPPMACVFLEARDGASRHRDFTCNAAFARYVVEDVLTWARRQAPTAAPGEDLLAGLSLSGLAAVHAAACHPGAFSRVLAQSGSFWWVVQHEPELPPCAVRAWLSVGDEEVETGVTHAPTDMVQSVSQVAGVEHVARWLEGCGAAVSRNVYQGGHDPAAWRAELPRALEWLVGTSSATSAGD